MSDPFQAVVFVCFSLYLFSAAARYLLHSSKLPPGPKGWPVIGNLYDVPRKFAWLTYAEWGKKYGEISSFTILGQDTIVLNSYKAVNELLEKRSSNYSDRPRMVLANELMGWDWDFVHMGYSDLWRQHRRVFHQYFQPRNLTSYYPAQREARDKLLNALLHTPSDLTSHVRHYVGSIVLKVTYGYEANEERDFYVDLASKAVHSLQDVVHAGSNLIEYIPFLKHTPSWFPGGHFKTRCKEAEELSHGLRDIPFNMVERKMAEGVAQQSFVFDNLSRLKGQGPVTREEAETVRNSAGLAYLAGSDTTASVVRSFILAMAHYPHIQEKAQLMIDQITNGTRLPDFADRESLPYLDAILTELLRWAPVTPLAVPHRAIEDDVYEGYIIPAGSTVIGNAWAILNDPELYPEPSQFRPERFMESKSGKKCPDPFTVGAFGFGRRICPGRYLALTSAWIAIASILSTFNITKAKDEDGNVIEPSISYTDGIVSHPVEFTVDITPRSKATTALIELARTSYSL